MNRRLSVWVVVTLLGFAAAARGQAAPSGSGLPGTLQTNPVESPQDKATIGKFIGDQMKDLAGADPVAQTAARKTLLAQLTRGSTPAYYSAFAQNWMDSSTAALKKSPSVSVRLNIAIVTTTLTDNGMVLDPEPLIVTLINDKDPSVSLWGIKAAKPMVMVLLSYPAVGKKPAVLAHPTVPAVIDAVKRHANTDLAGLLASDAYSALVVNALPGGSAAQAQAMAVPLVDPILDILEFRVGQYQSGVHSNSDNKLAVPQDPGAEHVIGTFLSTEYTNAVPPLPVLTQKRIAQDLVNLLTYIGDRAEVYEANKVEMAEARDTMRYTASALKVLSPPSSNNLAWFNPPPPGSTAKDIKARTDKVFDQISKSDPNFKWLVQPPDVVPIVAPTSTDKPATAAAPTTPAH